MTSKSAPVGHSSRGVPDCQADRLFARATCRNAYGLATRLVRRCDARLWNRTRFESTMKKNRDAPIPIVCCNKSRFFDFLSRYPIQRDRERTGFCSIITRWVLEGTISLPEEDREIVRLQIHDSDIRSAVAVEIAG